MPRIKVSAEATSEMAEAAKWYDGKRRGLGAEFVAACDLAFEKICQTPERNMSVGKRFRRFLMQRFPYVVAVFHGGRDPARWRKQIGLD